MTTLSPTARVGDLVAHCTAMAEVFERHGIDYCCGGASSLGEACAARGLDLHELLDELEVARTQRAHQVDFDLTLATPTELADHIERTHHAWLRQELPRLRELIAKVAVAHGDSDDSLGALAAVFSVFAREMAAHMLKEEQVLFPMIRALERTGAPTPAGHGMEAPIGVMLHEHESSGAALKCMRDLTNGFTAPAHACTTYRVMLDALSRLERDTHRHVHKENNLLFPKALTLEEAARTRAAGSTAS